MDEYKIERFRGLVRGSAKDGLVELELVAVEGGYELHCSGFALASVRGGVRVFRNAQSAIQYVQNNLCAGFNGHIVVKVRLHGSQLF